MEMSKAVAKAIAHLVERKITELAPTVEIAVFQNTESIDANLSQVISGGNIIRYVPKLSSVGSMAANDQIYLLKGAGAPMIILGKVSGNIKAVL